MDFARAAFGCVVREHGVVMSVHVRHVLNLSCLQVFEGYGQTEGTAGITFTLFQEHTGGAMLLRCSIRVSIQHFLFFDSGHVGPPLPCNHIKLVDVADMDYFAKDGK